MDDSTERPVTKPKPMFVLALVLGFGWFFEEEDENEEEQDEGSVSHRRYGRFTVIPSRAASTRSFPCLAATSFLA